MQADAFEQITLSRDLSQANQIAGSSQFAINETRRRVSPDMPRPNLAPEPALLPQQLINVGHIDEDRLRRRHRRVHKRSTAHSTPPAIATCLSVPRPHYVHYSYPSNSFDRGHQHLVDIDFCLGS